MDNSHTISVCYEFLGGPLDGKAVSENSSLPSDRLLAEFLDGVTQGGTQPASFTGLDEEYLSEWDVLRLPPDEAAGKIYSATEFVTRDDGGTLVYICQVW